jgi:hypothetical protein
MLPDVLMTGHKAGLALILLVAVLAVSCNRFNPAAKPASVPQSANKEMSSDKEVDVAALDFDTVELKNRFQLFDRTAREIAAADNGWKHCGYTRGMNYVSAVWAHGKGYDNECLLNLEARYQVGTRKIEVDTIVVGKKAKAAGITIQRVDASPKQWSASGYYREATGDAVLIGGGWGVMLFKWDAQKQKSIARFRPTEEPTVKIHLASQYVYYVENTPVDVAFDLPLGQDISRYLISAQSLRDTYLRASGQLLQKVEETISNHKAEKRILGEDNVDGTPPASSARPLTTAEEATELAKARKHFAALDKIVSEEYVELHAALRKTFPFEKCWPELATTAAK